MFENEIEIRYFEMNRFGETSATAMLTILEEVAANHCLAIGYGLYDLLKQNIGWVLLSGYMQMDRYPRYKEKIKVRTWISQYQSVRAIRENLIFDENGNIIGSSRSRWLFFDIEKRRPVYIFPEIRERWGCFEEVSSDIDVSNKIDEDFSASFKDDFVVTHFDLDTNEHLNNIRYLQWLIETIPIDIQSQYFLHSINGRFIGEAHYKDKIESLTDPLAEENSFIHKIINQSTGKTCATGITVWKKRST